jgi:hypothetical protein
MASPPPYLNCSDEPGCTEDTSATKTPEGTVVDETTDDDVREDATRVVDSLGMVVESCDIVVAAYRAVEEEAAT